MVEISATPGILPRAWRMRRELIDDSLGNHWEELCGK
jgi:hypothetical protein